MFTNKMVSIKKYANKKYTNLVNNLKDYTIRKNSSDTLYNNTNSLSKLCSEALIASMIYFGSMNVMTASSKYLPNHNTADTTIAASHIREIVEKSDATTIDTSKIHATKTDIAYMDAENINKEIKNARSIAIAYSETAKNIFSPDFNSLDKVIASYADSDNYMFYDNDYYKMIRENDALLQIKKYDINTESTVMIVNKTFQKAMIVRMEKQAYIYSIDSLDSFIKQGRNVKVSKNDPDKLVEMVLEPEILFETDCSTARIYGTKSFNGDSKTPEGIFRIYSVEDSHDWTFDGKWVYGPNFLRIKDAIGIHGNGTDTSNTSNNTISTMDKRFKGSEPLGIYSNNFAHGLSHGCIRLDNGVIYKLVNGGILKNGVKVIIFENKKLTETLLKHYPASVNYKL